MLLWWLLLIGILVLIIVNIDIFVTVFDEGSGPLTFTICRGTVSFQVSHLLPNSIRPDGPLYPTEALEDTLAHPSRRLVSHHDRFDLVHSSLGWLLSRLFL